MTKYQEFLNKAHVISEELFYEIVDSLPEYDNEKTSFEDLYEFDSQDEIASEIIATILLNWPWVTCENVNFESKSFDLVDVQSLKDLEEIKETFSKWTINNYDQCKESCIVIENEEEKADFIRNYDFSNVPLEELKEFLKQYEN
jgi:hypothetical protein